MDNNLLKAVEELLDLMVLLCIASIIFIGFIDSGLSLYVQCLLQWRELDTFLLLCGEICRMPSGSLPLDTQVTD